MADLPRISLAKSLIAPSGYRDRSYTGPPEAYDNIIQSSTTVYVGNMSFFTTEEQVYTLFSFCGEIKRIIMGLNKQEKTPCGFCFVEFYERRAAMDAVRFLGGLKLDERFIRVDFDWGFVEGRQYGRGRSGGQVRDEHRIDFDPGRGGYGGQLAQDESRLTELKSTYQDYYKDGRNAGLGAPETTFGTGIAKQPRKREDDPEGAAKRLREDEDNPRFRRERSDY